MKATLSIISFMECTFGVVSKRSLTQELLDFLLCSLAGILWFGIFTFKSGIHFKLIFVQLCKVL